MTIQTTDIRINRLLKKHLLEEFSKILHIEDPMTLYQYEGQLATAFANFIGTRFSHIVNSGTTAIKLALCLANIQEGDEVIVPVAGYPSTVLPILELGAVPVFVDVTKSIVIDPECVMKKITEKTKAIIPVHLFGHVCDMESINTIAKKYDLAVIEDCCQSHGSTFNEKVTGNLGTMGAFSFTVHKSLPGFTGGALTYTNSDYASRLETYRYIDLDDPSIITFGRSSGLLSTLEIANIMVKLRLFNLIKQSKDSMKHQYFRAFQDCPQLRFIQDDQNTYSVRQHVVLEVENRESLLTYLKERNIDCDSTYKPLHQLQIFQPYVNGESFPVAEKFATMGIHLPSSPFLTKDEIRHVTDSILSFFSRG